MTMPSLENRNEAHIVSVNGFKHQAGLKMYTQLPDYGDFQGYDQGAGGVLSQIPHKFTQMPIIHHGKH